VSVPQSLLLRPLRRRLARPRHATLLAVGCSFAHRVLGYPASPNTRCSCARALAEATASGGVPAPARLVVGAAPALVGLVVELRGPVLGWGRLGTPRSPRTHDVAAGLGESSRRHSRRDTPCSRSRSRSGRRRRASCYRTGSQRPLWREGEREGGEEARGQEALMLNVWGVRWRLSTKE